MAAAGPGMRHQRLALATRDEVAMAVPPQHQVHLGQRGQLVIGFLAAVGQAYDEVGLLPQSARQLPRDLHGVLEHVVGDPRPGRFRPCDLRSQPDDGQRAAIRQVEE